MCLKQWTTYPAPLDVNGPRGGWMFGALDALFSDTCINPKDTGMLVVNSSWFNPTPSLSAMIVKKYKLWGNIRSFFIYEVHVDTQLFVSS